MEDQKKRRRPESPLFLISSVTNNKLQLVPEKENEQLRPVENNLSTTSPFGHRTVAKIFGIWDLGFGISDLSGSEDFGFKQKTSVLKPIRNPKSEIPNPK
ncbi:MAG: hypothetical protein JSS81_22935 [Acidobacteria bacterium]|nr:hypothetical protein [Acidobacteriota bacterium]